MHSAASLQRPQRLHETKERLKKEYTLKRNQSLLNLKMDLQSKTEEAT